MPKSPSPAATRHPARAAPARAGPSARQRQARGAAPGPAPASAPPSPPLPPPPHPQPEPHPKPESHLTAMLSSALERMDSVLQMNTLLFVNQMRIDTEIQRINAAKRRAADNTRARIHNSLVPEGERWFEVLSNLNDGPPPYAVHSEYHLLSMSEDQLRTVFSYYYGTDVEMDHLTYRAYIRDAIGCRTYRSNSRVARSSPPPPGSATGGSSVHRSPPRIDYDSAFAQVADAERLWAPPSANPFPAGTMGALGPDPSATLNLLMSQALASAGIVLPADVSGAPQPPPRVPPAAAGPSFARAPPDTPSAASDGLSAAADSSLSVEEPQTPPPQRHHPMRVVSLALSARSIPSAREATPGSPDTFIEVDLDRDLDLDLDNDHMDMGIDLSMNASHPSSPSRSRSPSKPPLSPADAHTSPFANQASPFVVSRRSPLPLASPLPSTGAGPEPVSPLAITRPLPSPSPGPRLGAASGSLPFSPAGGLQSYFPLAPQRDPEPPVIPVGELPRVELSSQHALDRLDALLAQEEFGTTDTRTRPTGLASSVIEVQPSLPTSVPERAPSGAEPVSSGSGPSMPESAANSPLQAPGRALSVQSTGQQPEEAFSRVTAPSGTVDSTSTPLDQHSEMTAPPVDPPLSAPPPHTEPQMTIPPARRATAPPTTAPCEPPHSTTMEPTRTGGPLRASQLESARAAQAPTMSFEKEAAAVGIRLPSNAITPSTLFTPSHSRTASSAPRGTSATGTPRAGSRMSVAERLAANFAAARAAVPTYSGTSSVLSSSTSSVLGLGSSTSKPPTIGLPAALLAPLPEAPGSAATPIAPGSAAAPIPTATGPGAESRTTSSSTIRAPSPPKGSFLDTHGAGGIQGVPVLPQSMLESTSSRYATHADERKVSGRPTSMLESSSSRYAEPNYHAQAHTTGVPTRPMSMLSESTTSRYDTMFADWEAAESRFPTHQHEHRLGSSTSTMASLRGSTSTAESEPDASLGASSSAGSFLKDSTARRSEREASASASALASLRASTTGASLDDSFRYIHYADGLLRSSTTTVASEDERRVENETQPSHERPLPQNPSKELPLAPAAPEPSSDLYASLADLPAAMFSMDELPSTPPPLHAKSPRTPSRLSASATAPMTAPAPRRSTSSRSPSARLSAPPSAGRTSKPLPPAPGQGAAPLGASLNAANTAPRTPARPLSASTPAAYVSPSRFTPSPSARKFTPADRAHYTPSPSPGPAPPPRNFAPSLTTPSPRHSPGIGLCRPSEMPSPHGIRTVSGKRSRGTSEPPPGPAAPPFKRRNEYSTILEFWKQNNQ